MNPQKQGGNFDDDKTNTIRLVKKECAHLFKEATIKTTGGPQSEVYKIVLQLFHFYADFND